MSQQHLDPAALEAALREQLIRGEVPALKDLTRTNRALRFSAAGLTVDLSRQRLDPARLAQLTDYAELRSLSSARARMLAGERINLTEGRAVLHTALRIPDQALDAWCQSATDQSIDLTAAADQVRTSRQQMQRLVTEIHQGQRVGYTGRRFTDVVNIGIGGSHLGPEHVVDALGGGTRSRLRAHFLSNIDGHSLTRILRDLNPETTLFVIVSKSFKTLETALNADAARSWLLERTASTAALNQHFIAVSNNLEAAARFGVSPELTLGMGDWVGGRYSLWSAAGISIALALGWATFEAVLSGARMLDEHFASAPLGANMPILLALCEWWNVQLLNCTSHAVLAYDDRLQLLPDFLQQLEMESNGKRVDLAGQPLTTRTQPVLWGGVGTNGQHAFHQLLHQGTESYFADYLICRGIEHNYPDHHRWLIANALAQGQGMSQGTDHEDPHRQVPGNHPSSTIILDSLTPATLGALLALYEHKVFCLGILWNINSFDQWGVELGKVLATELAAELSAVPVPPPAPTADKNQGSGQAADQPPQDMATQQLLNLFR